MPKRSSSLATQLLDTLEERGHRSTSPRKAVINPMAAQNKHFTAEELSELLPSDGLLYSPAAADEEHTVCLGGSL